MKYSAIREKLMHYSISDETNKISTIETFNGIWAAEGAPLTPLMGKVLTSFPKFIMDGVEYYAHLKLMTNRWLMQDYEIRLEGKDGTTAIEFFCPAKWTYTSNYQGNDYQLQRHSLFNFHFTLTGGDNVVEFRDVTPFFTFSSMRKFEISSRNPVDHLLLSSSFFIAENRFFH